MNSLKIDKKAIRIDKLEDSQRFDQQRLAAFEQAARELVDHFACEECNCAGLKPAMDKLRALVQE